MSDNHSIKVFFFGDSICFGQGLAIHKGWVTRISAILDRTHKDYGREILVTNASISGNTTRMALERMPYDIQSHQADILIVQFGMNDCNRWQTDRGNPRVSPRAFRANLEEIIVRAFSFGTKTILLNTNHPTGLDQELMPFTEITYQQSNEQYNEIVRDVASEFGDQIVLRDIELVFRSHAGNSREALLSLLLPDLLHLSELGHDLYFKSIWPAVNQAVRDLIGRHDHETNSVPRSKTIRRSGVARTKK